MAPLTSLINKLKYLQKEQNSMSLSIEPDKEGYSDRECPNEDCRFPFKVFEEDWVNIFRDDAVFCPACGHKSLSNTFWSSAHIEQVKDQLIEKIRTYITTDAIFSPEFSPLLPLESYRQKIKCEMCSARYAVIGSAFFCPCCGNNSIIKTFYDSINKVEVKLNSIPNFLDKLEADIGKDAAAIISRSLIETCLSDLVVAFQRLSEEFYRVNINPDIKSNVFQRIKEGSDLWLECIGQGYEDWITSAEIKVLNQQFQKRHLLQHKEGIVDQKYLNNSGDNSYVVGQRIVIKERDVIELRSIIEKVIVKLKAILDERKE